MKLILKLILIVLIILSILFSVGVSTIAFFVMKYSDDSLSEDLIQIDASSHKTEFYCFDHINLGGRENVGETRLIEGAILDSGTKYIYTSLNEMPSELINAFVAIEDKRFYEHNGIDMIRTAKAVLNYFSGKKRFGGSTITQQLVKNLTGKDEVTIERKIKEGITAINIEKKYDKSEILEQYLNVINLSGGCMGVGAASEYYYSKKPIELTLSESATIAAITNNPSLFDPIKHPENNLKRRNTILLCMYEQNYISKEQYLYAIDTPIALNIPENAPKSINSWYIDMVTADVIEDLSKKYEISHGAASLMLYRGGYKIYTAMDETVQEVVESYYSDEYNFPVDEQGNMAQSSMIIIDPYTGDILGVAGAVGKKSGSRVQNYATDTRRPPGSTIKPLSVYAPAIDKGIIEWSSLFEDSPIISGDESTAPWPQNVDRKYRGVVDVKYAVEHSLNTVPVRILDILGANVSVDFLKNKLLISSLDKKRDAGRASLALGQPENGVTLRELTAAYSIFQEGVMSRSRSYYKVTDASGRIIVESKSEFEAVISKESAAIMTKLLETVVDTGTASGKVKLDKSIDVAGKSGTSGNCCDRYFIGYTPRLLGGVWFGYDYPKNLESFGGNVSVYIWDDVMSEIYERVEGYKKAEFSIPDTVQKLSYERPNNLIDGEAPSEHIVDEGWFNINHKGQ